MSSSKIVEAVLTPHCYNTYFNDLDFFDGPCFTSTLSKLLGLAVIVVSVLVKLPQIIKIYKSKSGEGINIFSVTLDLATIIVYSSYSILKKFPFTQWGESLFSAIQTVLVGVLVLYYRGESFKAVLFIVIYGLTSVLAASGLVPLQILWALQGMNIVLVVTGKMAQAYTNYKNGHTGQLSAITLSILFWRAAARIFTSIQETGDHLVIITYAVGTLANGILIAQLVYYWNARKAQKKSKK